VTFSFDPALAATLSTLEHRYGLNLPFTANEKREPTERVRIRKHDIKNGMHRLRQLSVRKL
jgi:hypothetical protein